MPSASPLQASATGAPEPPTVNYDEPALVEFELEAVEYRIDPGKHGTALSISTRAPGCWQWSFVSEGRWDGSTIRARAFDRRTLEPLSKALKAALEVLE